MGSNKINSSSTQKVSLVTITVNGALAIFKAIFGIFFNSAALLADAFHSISDILSSGIVFLGIKFANKPADNSHHYGHGKLESVASKVVALVLIVTALLLGHNAINMFFQPATLPGTGALIGAFVSIIVKELLYRYNITMGERYQSSALKADAWHNRSDAITSVAALIGVAGARLGFPALDPLGALIVSVLILKVGIEIYLTSIKELIDTAPTTQVISEIERIVNETEGIENVHDIKARYHGTDVFVDIKVCVDRNKTVAQGHHYAGTAKHKIIHEIPQIRDVLIHVNPCKDDVPQCSDCHEAICSEAKERTS